MLHRPTSQHGVDEERHKFAVITVRLQQFSTYSTQCKMRNTIFGRYIRQQREKIGWPTNQQRTERRQRSSSQLQRRRRRGGVVFRIFHPSFVPLPHHRPFFHLLGPRSFLSPAPAPECLATNAKFRVWSPGSSISFFLSSCSQYFRR